MITRTIDLNLIPGKEIVHIHLSQRDVISAGLVFRLWNNQTRYTIPTGATGTIEGTKRDRCAFQYNTTVSAAANTVTANITYQMTCIPGPVPCELRLRSSSGYDLGTANFILDIEPGALIDEPDISKSELKLIEQQAKNKVTQIDGYIASAKSYSESAANQANIAADYANKAQTEYLTIVHYIDTAKGIVKQSEYYVSRSKDYLDRVYEYVKTSQGYANTAKGYANTASQWATLSESWAIGATGARDGEDTNNSKYWSQISESYAQGGTTKRSGEETDNSKYWNQKSKENYEKTLEYKNTAETYTNIIIPEFEIDFETMLLYQTNYVEDSNLQFSLGDDKKLYYELIA